MSNEMLLSPPPAHRGVPARGMLVTCVLCGLTTTSMGSEGNSVISRSILIRAGSVKSQHAEHDLLLRVILPTERAQALVKVWLVPRKGMRTVTAGSRGKDVSRFEFARRAPLSEPERRSSPRRPSLQCQGIR